MDTLDLSQLTVTELNTLKTDALANLARSANSTTYGIGTRNLTRRGATVDLQILHAVNAELSARDQTIGRPGIATFGEPE